MLSVKEPLSVELMRRLTDWCPNFHIETSLILKFSLCVIVEIEVLKVCLCYIDVNVLALIGDGIVNFRLLHFLMIFLMLILL